MEIITISKNQDYFPPDTASGERGRRFYMYSYLLNYSDTRPWIIFIADYTRDCVFCSSSYNRCRFFIIENKRDADCEVLCYITLCFQYVNTFAY